MNCYFSKLSLLILLLLTPFVAVAQDDRLDELGFEEANFVEEKPPYFAIGGGYLGMFHFLDYAELNILSEAFSGQKFDAPMYLSGVGGVAPVIIVKNLRISVFGVGGSSYKDQISGDTSRRVTLGVGMNGFGVDYAFQPFKKFSILAGVTGGWGTYSLERARSVGERTYSEPFPSTSNYHTKLQSSFGFLQPTLNAEYAITQFSMITVGLGYTQSFMGDWKADALDKTVSGVPSGLNANGLSMRFGIYIGLFN